MSKKRKPTQAEQAHMAAVVSLGCVICGLAAEAHHIRTGMGVGQRNDNFHIIGLCPIHHRLGPMGVAFHAGSRTWQRIHGTEMELLARVCERLKEIA